MVYDVIKNIIAVQRLIIGVRSYEIKNFYEEKITNKPALQGEQQNNINIKLY